MADDPMSATTYSPCLEFGEIACSGVVLTGIVMTVPVLRGGSGLSARMAKSLAWRARVKASSIAPNRSHPWLPAVFLEPRADQPFLAASQQA